MRIEFAPEAMQDMDGLTRVCSEGLLRTTVRVESVGLSKMGEVKRTGWDDEEEAYGLVLFDDETKTETFVPFSEDLTVVYL